MTINYAEVVNLQLQVAMLVAPTEKEAAGFIALVNVMRNYKEPHKAIATELSSAISDGLNRGNWPKTNEWKYRAATGTNVTVTMVDGGMA